MHSRVRTLGAQHCFFLVYEFDEHPTQFFIETQRAVRRRTTLGVCLDELVAITRYSHNSLFDANGTL
jgi:hypothetical protein